MAWLARGAVALVSRAISLTARASGPVAVKTINFAGDSMATAVTSATTAVKGAVPRVSNVEVHPVVSTGIASARVVTQAGVAATKGVAASANTAAAMVGSMAGKHMGGGMVQDPTAAHALRATGDVASAMFDIVDAAGQATLKVTAATQVGVAGVAGAAFGQQVGSAAENAAGILTDAAHMGVHVKEVKTSVLKGVAAAAAALPADGAAQAKGCSGTPPATTNLPPLEVIDAPPRR